MTEAKRSDNVVEETWLAYAYRDEAGEGAIRSALARVEAHYGALVAEPLERAESLGPRHGLAFWRPADDRLSWPLWVSAGEALGRVHSRPDRLGADRANRGAGRRRA